MQGNRRGRPRHPDVLTPAEWRVLEALREGGTNAEIAERLGVSTNTVRYHVSNMLAKLELRDRRSLAAWRPDTPRRRLGGVLAVPAVLWSVGRPLAWAGVGAAALAGVVVVVVALVALEGIVEGDGDSPAAVALPSEATSAPAPTATPTAAPTVAPMTALTATPTATPLPSPTFSPRATPDPPTAATATLPLIRAPALAPPISSPTFETPPGVYTSITVGAWHACALTESSEAVCWDIGDGAVWETPPGPYTFITAEGSETCAITGSGEIACWTWDGEPETPVEWPPGHYSAVSLSNHGYSCALTYAGEAVCVGSDAWPEPPAGPFVAITKASRFYALGTEYLIICARTEAGEGVCWGAYGGEQFAGSSGQLTDNAYGSYTAIVTTVNDFCGLTTDGQWTCETGHDPSTRYTAISTSGLHLCAVTEAGKAVCGAASPNWVAGSEMVMNPPDPAPDRYMAVSVGRRFGTSEDRSAYGCALTETGRAVCWGNTENKVARPEAPPGGYTAVSEGWGHTCALAAAGEAVCWGWNNFGQTDAPPGPYTAVSAGDLGTCAITAAGMLVCWGGFGFVDVESDSVRYRAISAGVARACALTEDGDLVCWDWNRGAATEGTPAGPFVGISLGWGEHACALTAAGEAVCWDLNTYGQADVPPGHYRAVSAGESCGACALTEDGRAACWGDIPSPPAGRYTAIDAGSRGACAITDAGGVMCWGRPAGLADPPDGPYTSISSAPGRACAITEAGEIVCWGDRGHRFPPSVDPTGTSRSCY